MLFGIAMLAMSFNLVQEGYLVNRIKRITRTKIVHKNVSQGCN